MSEELCAKIDLVSLPKDVQPDQIVDVTIRGRVRAIQTEESQNAGEEKPVTIEVEIQKVNLAPASEFALMADMDEDGE